MRIRKVVDAMELKPGDKIVLPGGRVETVTEKSIHGKRYNDVTVHTDKSSVLTGLPCPVKVVDG